ncbi:MAG: transposase, partial [Anaerolineaceae bacterium]
FPSSQICNICGYKNTSIKDLSIRKWECSNCHSHHDRDINASINILNEGLRILSA